MTTTHLRPPIIVEQITDQVARLREIERMTTIEVSKTRIVFNNVLAVLSMAVSVATVTAAVTVWRTQIITNAEKIAEQRTTLTAAIEDQRKHFQDRVDELGRKTAEIETHFKEEMLASGKRQEENLLANGRRQDAIITSLESLRGAVTQGQIDQIQKLSDITNTLSRIDERLKVVERLSPNRSNP